MSDDRLPVGDLDGSVATGPWTCPKCGRENKAAWRQCPGCESDRAGQSPSQRAPARPRQRTNPIYLLIGVLVLAALVVAVFLVAEPVWDWVVGQWDTFITWIDERT